MNSFDLILYNHPSIATSGVTLFALYFSRVICYCSYIFKYNDVIKTIIFVSLQSSGGIVELKMYSCVVLPYDSIFMLEGQLFQTHNHN